MKTIKIVGSQPTSDGERTEASPTRKSTRVRDNALLQSPVDTMSRKNNKVVGKQNEQRKKYILPMQTDEDAEQGERLLTPISTSSSSSTLPLVRSGSSNTTQLPQNKNGISSTPQPTLVRFHQEKSLQNKVYLVIFHPKAKKKWFYLQIMKACPTN